MKLTASVKLKMTPAQSDSLLATLERCNQCCNWLSERAWETQTWQQYALHRLFYHEARARFGLTAQATVRAIGKVADAYKLDRSTQRTFRLCGSIAYDDRILRWYCTQQEVSPWTLNGRERISFVCGDPQKALLRSQQGESDLILRDGEWYLSAACNVDDPAPLDVEGVLGVDLGIVELATDSNGTAYSGGPVKTVRRRTRRLRAGLQKCGTQSAKRHLKKIRVRASRFTRDTNHVIAKKIVQTAVDSRKAIGLEDLKGIRDRSNGFNREMRWQMGNWAFDQLGGFIRYKARGAGIPVIFIDPRNTSRTCSTCGHCDKANRKSQSQFLCLSCGFESNADRNAAVVIGARAVVSLPMVAALNRASYKSLTEENPAGRADYTVRGRA